MRQNILSKKIFLPLILLIFSFLVYIKTMPPSMLWVDSGTMIAASYSLGIPNPPGFPFYILVSHLFSMTPFFNVLTRLELFTIVFSLGTLVMVYKIILLLIKSDFFSNKSASSGFLPYLSAFFGAFSLAFSYQFWSQSQNTEAFIFTYFFVAFFTYLTLLLFRHLAKRDSLQNDDKSYSNSVFKILFLIAFLYGLAAGGNPTAAVLVPGVLFVMFLNRNFLSFKKTAILGFVFLLTLLLIYSYLPIRAKTYPFVNWGNPQTLELFIGHLKGAGLNIYEPEGGSINGFTGSPEVFFQTVSYYILQSFLQFTPFLFPFIVLGAYSIFRKNKNLFWFLTSVPVFNVFYAGIYYSGNQESWFILSWIFFAIFMGAGFYWVVNHFLFDSLIRHSGDSRILFWRMKIDSGFAKMTLLFSLCLLPLIVWFSFLNRGEHYYSFDYAYNLYHYLEKNAILLGTGDFQNSLGYYQYVVEKMRPDIIPVTVNMFYVNRWHRDGLKHATNLVISDKLEKIIRYKSFSEYNESMNEFIADNIEKRPIYVTPLALRASALAATTGGQLKLDSRFKFVPNGLTLKIVKTNENAIPNLSAFDFKFKSDLTKKPFYLERNYKSGFSNMLNDYVYAYEALGDWYKDKNEFDSAFKYYKKAEELEPDNAELLAHFGEFYAEKKDFNASYQYLQKAVILSPQNISMHFNLGLSLINFGKTKEAQKEFETVKQLAPIGDSIVGEANNILDNLALNLKSKKAKTGNFKVAFIYPPGWIKQESQSGIITLKNPSIAFTVMLSRFEKESNQTVNDYINSSDRTFGTLLNQGLAKIPNVDFAYVKIFSDKGINKMQFFLFKEDKVLEVLVYPSDSALMREFDKIVGSIRFE